jgi:uncharacterized Zn ribbon protein
MIKCKCDKCSSELVYESHKQAWMDGWNFVNSETMICSECGDNNVKNEKNED